MTIRELYEYASSIGCEDLPLRVAYYHERNKESEIYEVDEFSLSDYSDEVRIDISGED